MDPFSLAKRFHIPTANSLEEYPFVVEKKALIPYSFAKQKKVLPVEETKKGILVALADLTDEESLEEVALLLQKPVFPLYAPSQAIEKALESCYAQKAEETKTLVTNLESKEAVFVEEGYDLLEKGEGHPIIQTVNAFLIEALQMRASDIHFEPTEEGLSVRYRIDGMLHNKHLSSKESQEQILTRLKVLSKLDIAETRLPQDGRMKLRHGRRSIDFRVSTLPIVQGERIVLRILDKSHVLFGLDNIGMDPSLLGEFRKCIHLPEGILLVTGPTGSGKTTTLYSALREVDHAQMNVMTIEDPVEYKIEGISQIHVNSKIDLTFAKGLRHILRQDPDVILVGEIRDLETAEIALQASLTGHLVLSTLHTNDAPSALTRLIEMGIEPYLLASSLIAVVAQRLLRKICPHCKESYEPSSIELEELHLQREDLLEGKLCRGKGCPACFGSGFSGRAAIYEFMPMTPALKEQVVQSGDAHLLRKIALSNGMTSLLHQGRSLVLSGISTAPEMLRVIRLETTR